MFPHYVPLEVVRVGGCELWLDYILPCPLDEHIIFEELVLNEAWDNVHDCFITPPTYFTEYHMAEWLNKLGGLIGVFTDRGSEHKRSWCARAKDKQPEGASINCKPLADLALVSR